MDAQIEPRVIDAISPIPEKPKSRKLILIALSILSIIGIGSSLILANYSFGLQSKLNDQQKTLDFVANQYNTLAEKYDQLSAKLDNSEAKSQASDSISFVGSISQVTTRLQPDGTRVIIAQGEHHNTMTDFGRGFFRNLAIGNPPTYQNLTFIGFGNGTTPTSASVDLNNRVTGCGFDISAGTVIINNASSFTIQKVATSTCTIVVNNTGIFNTTASSTGLAFGGNIPNPPSQFQPSDQITQNYTINIP
jgi:hypothetical protein